MAVTIRGANGAALVAGQVITGAAQRGIAIENGLARCHYAARTPDVQRGCHMLQVPINGAWVDALSDDMGDRAYFVSSIGNLADSTTVIEASESAVEIAVRWNVQDFAATPVTMLDDGHLVIYAESSAVPRTHTATRLTKSIRMVDGVPGYFVGLHSSPRIGPSGLRIPTDNNDNSFGERELALGGNCAVAWSSNPVRPICRWPAWGDDVDGRWTANGLAAVSNKVWWSGIDDPGVGTAYDTAGWIAVQGAGFPAEQADGPFYIGDLHSTLPICRVLSMRQRFEAGCWSQGLVSVLHYVNEPDSPVGIPYRQVAFIGGFNYYPRREAAYANEPTADVQARVRLLAGSIPWPTH